MRTIAKLVSINDGESVTVTNGNRMCVETYPRAEKMIEEFLNAGYELHSRVFRVTPAIQQEGSYSFYRNGWDFLFVKTIEDDEEDDSDEVMGRVGLHGAR